MNSPLSTGLDVNDDPSLTSLHKPHVLFVCEGNTCRSVFAEYIARKKFARVLEAASAGIRPGTPEECENAIYTLRETICVDASGHIPRDVRFVQIECADLVVAMTSRIANQLRALFPALRPERLVRWRIKDPYGENLAEYRHCAQVIFKEMQKLPIIAIASR